MVAYIIAYSVTLSLLCAAVVLSCVIIVRGQKKKFDEVRISAGSVDSGKAAFVDMFGNDDDLAFIIADEVTHSPVYISPSIKKYVGLTDDELRIDFDGVKKNIDKKYIREFELGYAAWDRTSPYEQRFGYDNGKFAKLHLMRVERDGAGYIAASIYDITEQEQTHDEMQKQLDAALEQAAAKSSFLSSMSHEIRTPMNGVMGMMALAKMNIGNPDKVRNYLERAGELSVFLLSMINDILDISKIESGKMQLFNTELDIFAFAEKIKNMFHGTIESKGITFTVETVDFTSRYLIGDEMRLTQVVTNLVSNANKFTPTGGKIDVTFKQLDCIGGNAQLMIRVRDTGKGIAPENIHKIMRPFEQEEASTAHNYGGTGLGLAICDNIVRLMGGNIVIDSTLGKGSDFSVFVALPIADVQPDKIKTVTYEIESKKIENFEYDGCKILLAEDNEVNAEIAVDILESDGAVVTLAKDGQEAVDIFTDNPEHAFDVILMDIQMPRLNGRQAAMAIRDSNRADAQSIPIIALSADAFVEDIKLSEEAGMDAHVSKPVDFDALRKRVGEIIIAKKAMFAAGDGKGDSR